MPSVENMTSADTTRPQRVGFRRQLAIDTGYTLLGFPLATASFVVAVTGLSAGLGTLVVIVGLPVLAGTLLLARLFADIERLRIPAVLRMPRTRPIYRTSQRGDGIWKRMFTPLSQTQSWLDLVHAILHFPIAVTAFSVVVSWWASAIGGTSVSTQVPSRSQLQLMQIPGRPYSNWADPPLHRRLDGKAGEAAPLHPTIDKGRTALLHKQVR